MSIEDRVRAHCRRHDLLPDGAGVLALVSGGGDSICLMHVLASIHDGPVHVLAIDHGFRASSVAEADTVLAAARALGLPAHRESLGLSQGSAAMERARDARLAAAERVREREGLDLIATGHTRTDHAETILFRVARGTGRTGALGIAPRRDRLVRPLLSLSRTETRAWCDARGLVVVDDPTNADMRTARARVRHGVMPALEEVHPGAEAQVARFADLLADESEVITAVVDVAWRRHARAGGLDAAGLASEPGGVARLLVRRLLDAAGLGSDALAADVVDEAVAHAAQGRGRRDVPGGLVVVENGILVAESAGGDAPPAEAELRVPGTVRISGVLVRASTGPAGPTSPASAWVRARGPLVVRPYRAGDRIALGGGGHQAVGRLLQAAGVPARLKPRVPVVVEGDRVLWVAGYRADAGAIATPGEDAVHLEAVPA